MDRVFELFERGVSGSTDGLGIGLTLVRTIAELHGGTVRAESPGSSHGSTFILRLPVVVDHSTKAAVPERMAAISPKRCRAVIADDLKSSADTLTLLLDLDGLETSVAYDGKQAVELAMQVMPEIVCLDIGMPIMDGYEAAVKIRAFLPNATIIAVTGWGAEEDRRKTTASGFDFHLVKPVKVEELSKILRSRLPQCFTSPT